MDKSKQIRRRKCVLWFSKEMEKILRENDYKGGWDNCSTSYLFGRLSQERDELLIAIEDQKRLGKDVVKECVDIANFAMMIADDNR